jgi:hypothetical protein
LKRNLILLNVALLAVVGLLGWMLRHRWMEEQEQERKVRLARVRPPAVPQPAPLKKVPPIDGPSYAEVATKNLFSQDRNPQPIPDPPKPPPPPPVMPPLPVVYGVLMWGDMPPTVMASERGQGQKAYREGDKIGQFKLVSVSNKEIVLEWNGKKMTKSLDELMQKALFANADNPPANAPQTNGGAPAPAAAQAPGMTANAASAPPPSNDSGGMRNLAEGDKNSLSSSSAQAVPGKDVGGGIHTCVAGDTSPPGTVVDGLKKLVNTTPFGVTCRWEPVK